jgi:3-oxoacyl-[acyl-carrier-protein] synthase-3
MAEKTGIKRVTIVGTGSAVPDRVLTNSDLEKIVETSDEWITERTGIKERRIADEKTATSDLAVESAEKALKDANINAEDLDAIIVATSSPDMLFPSTACLVQHRLGAKKVLAYDLLAACSGFVYGLETVKGLVSSGIYKKVLLIGAETLSKITDYTDRTTCVILADGAGACVVTESDDESEILSTYMGSDGSLGDLISLPGGGSRRPASHQTVDNRQHYIRMNGNELFRHAVRAMGSAAEKALEKAGLQGKDINLFIPHQANLRIIKATMERLGIPMEKVYVNIDRFGNTSAASIAICLDEAKRNGKLKKGDLILLDAFGGGLTWGSVVLRW